MAILLEMENMISIIADRIKYIEVQQLSNTKAASDRSLTLSKPANTNFWVIDKPQLLSVMLVFCCNCTFILIRYQLFHFLLSLLLPSKPKKVSKKWTKYNITRYNQIDCLKEKIGKFPFNYLIHVSDEIICIEKDEMTDHQARFLTRKIFVHYLVIMIVRGYFSDVVYKYTRRVSISDWIVVFKVDRGAIYKSQNFIENIADATQQAPIFLSRREILTMSHPSDLKPVLTRRFLLVFSR